VCVSQYISFLFGYKYACDIIYTHTWIYLGVNQEERRVPHNLIARKDSCAQMYPKLSTIDVTAKTFFERLYLVPGLRKFAPWVNCPCALTPPHFTQQLFLDFLNNFFPHVAPHLFCQHDSPSNMSLSLCPRWVLYGPEKLISRITNVGCTFVMDLERTYVISLNHWVIIFYVIIFVGYFFFPASWFFILFHSRTWWYP